MNEAIAEREALWNLFLERFPLESLRQMTLEQYNQAGSDDHFCRWLEKHTESLGSIWGGSSFKFGVFSRLDKKEKSNPHLVFTDDYAWLKKYGSSTEQAFATVRKHVVTVAEAARAGDLEAIEQVDLGPVVKWKIAFLYQNRQDPCILCVFAARDLCAALGRKANHNEQLAPLQRLLMSRRLEQNLLAYSDQVWEQAQEWHRKHSLAEQALDFFSADPERFNEINVTKKMAGYRLSNDRELALLRQNGKLSLFVSPGNWQKAVAGLDGNAYSHEETRHSGLASCAPALAVGNPALSIKLADMDTLEALCLAYEMDSENEVMEIQSVTPNSKLQLQPLNQILFGPPGTGKTYNTINKALAILDPECWSQYDKDESPEARKALKARFDELVKEGRIDFVTFHQSFSYEDFVEGIRAESDGDSGQLTYDVVDGVFKRMCDAVAAKVTRSDSHEAMTLEGRRVWKMSLGNTQGDDAHIFDDCIEQGLIRLGYGSSHDYSECKTRSDVQRVLERSVGKIDNAYDYTVTSVMTLVNRMKIGDLVVVTDGNFKFRAIGEITGDYRCEEHYERDDSYAQVRPVKWLCQFSPSLPCGELINGRFSQMTLYELKAPTLIPEKLLALVNATASQAGSQSEPGATPSNKRVLIIDEINRGNVSRIFGELITLIEPSKRAGASEALTTTLPYSKRPFSVPDNLYLIGTMNTADRSLAGLDIALRRRFVFEEMAPNPGLLNGVVVEADGLRVDVAQLLAVMNERIELLLDRDHCLGHAYFIPLKGSTTPTLDQLGTIFKTQILPLLQEYFFEDWQRIAWVLNDHRKGKADQFLQSPQVDVAALFGDQVKVGSHRQRWTLNKCAFARIGAYAGIIEVAAKGGHVEALRAAAFEPAFEEEQVTS